jgi:hypothetical protein
MTARRCGRDYTLLVAIRAYTGAGRSIDSSDAYHDSNAINLRTSSIG